MIVRVNIKFSAIEREELPSYRSFLWKHSVELSSIIIRHSERTRFAYLLVRLVIDSLSRTTGCFGLRVKLKVERSTLLLDNRDELKWEIGNMHHIYIYSGSRKSCQQCFNNIARIILYRYVLKIIATCCIKLQSSITSTITFISNSTNY